MFAVYQGEVVTLGSPRHDALIEKFSAGGQDGRAHFDRYSYDLSNKTAICGTPGMGGYASYANAADAPGGSLAGRGPKKKLREAGKLIEANAAPLGFDNRFVVFATATDVKKNDEFYIQYLSGYWEGLESSTTYATVAEDDTASGADDLPAPSKN